MLLTATAIANAATLTGSCKSDGALAGRLVNLRDQGKTVEQALTLSSIRTAQVRKFATMLWDHGELRSMNAASVRKLVTSKCQETKGGDELPQPGQPLSCRVKALLAQSAAEARDKGFSRARVSQVLSGPDSELTLAEVRAVLDVAFGGMKGVAPDKIGRAVLQVCEQRKR